MRRGDPVRGILHSTDASSGVAVPIYDAGSNTARTLQSNEFLTIDAFQIVSDPGGDVHLFIGADATPGTGETVGRGTVAANGGIAHQHMGDGWGGAAGLTPWLVAPAGVVDVVFTGYVTQA